MRPGPTSDAEARDSFVPRGGHDKQPVGRRGPAKVEGVAGIAADISCRGRVGEGRGLSAGRAHWALGKDQGEAQGKSSGEQENFLKGSAGGNDREQ